MIAKYVFRNEMRGGSTSAFIADYTKKVREIDSLQVNSSNRVSLRDVEKARAETTEWKEKTKMMINGLNLPYAQGLILAFLRDRFPLLLFAITYSW